MGYVMSGLNSRDSTDVLGNSDKLIERYDPRTNTWHSVKPPNKLDVFETKQQIICVGSMNNKIYLFGCSSCAMNFSRVQIYDPATDTWSEIRTSDAPKRLSSPTAHIDKL